MIVVLDTNVLISALLRADSIPGRLVDLVADRRFQAAVSSVLVDEFERVLSYPRIQQALIKRVPASRIEQFRRDYFGLARLVPSEPPAETWVPGDPDDDHVIQCALTAQAERIVTGDGRFLEVKKVGAIHIVSPADFLDELR